MYIIGNGAMLCQRSELWNEIIGNLEDQHPDCIGEQLMLRCQQHPDRVTSVKYPVDFKDVEEGGCGQPCEIILPCGHKVSFFCFEQMVKGTSATAPMATGEIKPKKKKIAR